MAGFIGPSRPIEMAMAAMRASSRACFSLLVSFFLVLSGIVLEVCEGSCEWDGAVDEGQRISMTKETVSATPCTNKGVDTRTNQCPEAVILVLGRNRWGIGRLRRSDLADFEGSILKMPMTVF